jgi:isoleucyl-tRNA synthetase
MSDFKQLEERILKFWDDQDVFRKSTAQREGAKPFVFYEGPPTANGSPGIHHLIGRAFKDLFNRYQTMRGRFVLRKGGWDTHGLPVELGVEKALGFKSKKDIETYGIAAYNRKCRESVWQYKSEWERFTRRIGYWVDLDNAYVTYESSYMESLWAVIRKFWDRKLLYQAHRVVPFCTRCGTPLSSHEVNLGYKTVTDSSVYLKFRITKAPTKLKLPKGTFILAWTTTPWTLPGNIALAVGRDIRYVLARKGEEHFIVAEELANKVLGAPLAIEREFTGHDLKGIVYEPLFPVRALKSAKSYHVYEADFVTTTDGTGVVHTAVMYGEDDYKLGDALGLPKVHTVTEQGLFIGVSKELDGRYVKSAETERMITDDLRSRGLLLATVPYEHEYPFCWRCETPLLYYAKDSWFVRMSSVNRELLANNDTINWVPSHLKEGRFGQWIREGKDWAFSRERYWGTPLPVWMARDRNGKPVGDPLVVGSLDDLDTYRADKPAHLWVMRHGESTKNIAHIIDQGQTESPLTERGRAQVVEAAAALKRQLVRSKVKLAAIVASPIQRTQETAELMARELGIKRVIFEERLREIHLGPSLASCHDSAYHEQYPTYESKFSQRPPGGESLADLKKRMWDVLQDLNRQYAGKHVLVVSHEYPIWMLNDAANGWSMQQSIAEKMKRGDDFVTYAKPDSLISHNIPRDEDGNLDLHRPYIDAIKLKRRGSTKLMERIPEIADVWFDSGAMPYAQWHWPFEHTDTFKQQYPADFISEGIDQTRGWFYTLLAVATALGDKAPYRAVVSNSHVLDEKGEKMSKSKGNIVRPDEVLDAVGVDATRWYFYTVNNPGDPKLFSMREVRERLTGFMMTLSNCMRFYELYRSQHEQEHVLTNESELDRWIRSRLAHVTDVVTRGLDSYDLTSAARELERFVVDDFSQWWLRRSRKRTDALPLLRAILRHIALVSAPFIPFTAEDIWLKVRAQDDPLSVHLADWPAATEAAKDAQLEEQMTRVRQYITAGLAIRKEQGIRVRQPLSSVTVPGTPLHADLASLILDELNVKAVQYAAGQPVSLDTRVDEALRAEGYAREVMRAIQDMRKEAGCAVTDKVVCRWESSHQVVVRAMTEHRDMIAQGTGCSELLQGRQQMAPTVQKEFDVESGAAIWLGIGT